MFNVRELFEANGLERIAQRVADAARPTVF
jgi:hypothetical protein